MRGMSNSEGLYEVPTKLTRFYGVLPSFAQCFVVFVPFVVFAVFSSNEALLNDSELWAAPSPPVASLGTLSRTRERGDKDQELV